MNIHKTQPLVIATMRVRSELEVTCNIAGYNDCEAALGNEEEKASKL